MAPKQFRSDGSVGLPPHHAEAPTHWTHSPGWGSLRSLSPLGWSALIGVRMLARFLGASGLWPWGKEAQQASLGDLLDADNFSKPLFLPVSLPAFCSHAHFPPMCASHSTWSVEHSFSSPDSFSNFCFCCSPDTTLILVLTAILTLGRRERSSVQKLVAEFLSGCLSASTVPRILPPLHTPAAPPVKKGHLLSLPLSPRWSWNLFRSTECVESDRVPVPG